MLTKKRYVLEPPQVKGYLVKGERFVKWSEVSQISPRYNRENTSPSQTDLLNP
jgi:hypothetical protein